MDRGLLDAAEFNNASSDRILGFADVSKVCMLQSYHQNAEQFEIMFNKTSTTRCPTRCGRSSPTPSRRPRQDMSWKAIDRYSKDYVELQTKDKVKFYKTPDAVLKQQLEVYDEVVAKKAAENALFKEIVESQLAFAERATQWEQDTVVSRSMAFDHYFGPNAKPVEALGSMNERRHHPSRRAFFDRAIAPASDGRPMNVQRFLHTHRRHQHLGRQGRGLADHRC